ncbi:hypothetical protein SDC9_80121 [bioreactor metagenome]|uniref:Uncharacterized protein n=1 Tax=bioreactor metagenome TaxID=1076179 RepID=A0A644YY56_9ZZZZ
MSASCNKNKRRKMLKKNGWKYVRDFDYPMWVHAGGYCYFPADLYAMSDEEFADIVENTIC